MYTFKLLKRTQNRSEVGPYENLEFEVKKDGVVIRSPLYISMESDDLNTEITGNQELDDAIHDFLDKNYDVLHYYMD